MQIYFEVPPSGAATATTYAFSGANSGVVGVASGNITLTPTGGNWPNSVTLTLSDGGAGGTLTPSTLNPTGGTSTPVTFTYTAASAGTKTISSSSAGAMTDPGGWSFTASASVTVLMKKSRAWFGTKVGVRQTVGAL